MHILVVEDERELANALKQGIEAEDYSVRVCYTGEEGFYVVQAQPFDLMILDIMLPGYDGFEILATLRDRGVKTPVLLLTAKDSVEDRVRGLDTGADDYLVKPFAFPEFMARIRTLLRRTPAVYQRFRLTDLEIDAATRFVARGGRPIHLTPREFDLLACLLNNKGRIVSRETLAREIWKVTSKHVPLDNVIDTQIARLRRKIDGDSERKVLHTVRGVGFVLREEHVR